MEPLSTEVLLEHSSGGFLVKTLEGAGREVKAEAFGPGFGDAIADSVIGGAMKPADDLIDFVLVQACKGRLFSWFSHKSSKTLRCRQTSSSVWSENLPLIG
jgi:hypothetical protein